MLDLDNLRLSLRHGRAAVLIPWRTWTGGILGAVPSAAVGGGAF